MPQSYEERFARRIELVPSDPEQAAQKAYTAITMLFSLFRLSNLSHAQQKAEIIGLLAEHHRLFKTKVQNELLASQKETTDALASALGKAHK